MFLKMDGIQGESQDKAHPGEIELDSFSFGINNFSTIGSATGGAGAGKVSLQDIHFSAPISVASPLLFKACASGQHIKKAVLSVRKAGGDQGVSSDFMKVLLTDVLVSGYAMGSHELDNGFSALPSDQDLPSDQFSLTFKKTEILFASPRGVTGTPGVTNADGSVSAAAVIGPEDVEIDF
jgi:type VI secretion system secreted protein Hcp